MKKIFYLFFLSFFFSPVIFSQYASLYISHPQKFIWGQGTIEEATLVVQPNGSYANNDLYLTFSAASVPYLVPNDSVEVRMSFSMSKSFFTDLWLWIGSDTSKALLADRSKARATYDNIVGRRRDPALLENTYNDYYNTYNSYSYYNLSIYPMRGDGTRKIKLSYITTGNFNNEKLNILLPLWIIKSSKVQPKLSVYVNKNQTWGKPSILENRDVVFSSSVDSVFKDVWKTVLTSTVYSLLSTGTLEFPSLKNTSQYYFAEKSKKDSAGVYQITFQPFKLLNLNTSKKFLFLVNYDSLSGSSAYSKKEILNDVVTTLRTQLTSSDSFNVIFASKQTPFRVSQHWLPVDSATITSTFENFLMKNAVMDTFNLSQLLFNASDFLKQNGGYGTVLLLSSSEEYYRQLSASNKLVDSLLKVLSPKTQINVIDNNQRYHWYSVGSAYYYGNGYLYTLLCSLTKGKYQQYRIYGVGGNNQQLINQMLPTMRGTLEYFDFSTSLANGITYMKQTQGDLFTTINTATTTRQIGKYIGNFPLNLELSGIYDGTVIYKKITIPDSMIVLSDTTLNAVWANGIILSLDKYYYTETNKQQISELSMAYRVLSRYTAFLALEPGQKLCDTCSSNVGGIIVNNIQQQETKPPESYEVLQAYPNPFNPSTTLQLQLPHGIKPNEVSLTIYNTLGQIVKRFDTMNLREDASTKIVWDGKDENGRIISSGVYFVVMTTPKGKYSLKLMMLK